jgi:hypothetical protein
MIKSTDICVNAKNNIYVSRDLTYGRRKRPAAVQVATDSIKTFLPAFRTLLDLPDDVLFRIARIKGKYGGLYMSTTKTVVIDPLYKYESFLNTLAHELVHAEQYYQGRLEAVFDKKKGWLHHWKGEINASKGKTYNSYRNLPWEKEAFDRSGPLVKKAKEILEVT